MSSSDVETLARVYSLKNGGLPSPAPASSVSLTREHINEALLRSEDKGYTLTLTQRGLTDIGEEGAEELATISQEAETDAPLSRIALAHNRLTTLPIAFALLSHVRYLVLKDNNFTVFPDVLTVMPSLTTVDLSRNKIKRFPSQPGTLVKLEFLALSRNKIHKLPTYFPEFKELILCKLDHNPIDWPPRSILETSENLNNPEAMGRWIQRVRSWIEENAIPADRKMSDDSFQQDARGRSAHPDTTLDTSFGWSHLTTDMLSPNGLAHHSRSTSLESEHSTYFNLDHSVPSPVGSRVARPDMLPRLHLNGTAAASSSASVSPLRSNAGPVASDDVVRSLDATEKVFHRIGGTPSDSSPSASRHRSSRSDISLNKSLPDLRHGISPSATASTETALPVRSGSLPSGQSEASSRQILWPHEPLSASPQSTFDRSAPSMSSERNTYFRRMSALTPASLATSVPEELLVLVDAIRGILFAISQIYENLRYYADGAADDRLSVVLLKVLDPASAYMDQLIRALERFDNMSRRALPPPSVCRAVVESCRDNVTILGKAIGVLALQLKVLAMHDDVRYTRQMLLVLYGGMAEISNSWKTIADKADAVKPLLRDPRPRPLAKSHVAQAQVARTMGAPLTQDFARQPLSTPALPSPSYIMGREQPRSHLRTNTQGSADLGKVRSRRQAGSFSVKDVELGMHMAEADEALGSATPIIPTPRTMRRIAPPLGPDSAVSTPDHDMSSTSSPALLQRWDTHSRQTSQASIIPLSTSSPTISQKDTPTSTSAVVDKEFFAAMKAAVESAPPVWEMMYEMLNEAEGDNDELRQSLDNAVETTDKLKEHLDVIQDGRSATDGRPFREDAHLFIKRVIHLSNAVKAHGAALALSSTLRANMVKLTNATQEFVMLLHVSSFSAPASRAQTPILSATAQPSPLSQSEDGKLGANLSRSRSAFRSGNSKVSTSLRKPPHSALPHQTFAIPDPPRFGPMRNNMDDIAAVNA